MWCDREDDNNDIDHNQRDDDDDNDIDHNQCDAIEKMMITIYIDHNQRDDNDDDNDIDHDNVISITSTNDNDEQWLTWHAPDAECRTRYISQWR